MDRYTGVNRASWDERAAAHAGSPDYAFERFVADPGFLSGVVRFDLPRLGDLEGLRGVHLQCHIGTDTISLARLGARMTGLDFSPESLKQARRLAAATRADVQFVESEVYAAPAVLEPSSYDLVYTGIGAICWLPRIREWANVVAALLVPGGRLFIREGHPMLWTLADRTDDLLVVDSPYFETDEPSMWEGTGTYVATEVEFPVGSMYEWNHGVGEIVSAVMDAGLDVTMLVEHDSVPWEALPGLMERDEAGEWRLRDRPERLACSYTLQATKRPR